MHTTSCAHHLLEVLLVDALSEHAAPLELELLQEAVGCGLHARGQQAENDILCEVANEQRHLPQKGSTEHEALHKGDTI